MHTEITKTYVEVHLFEILDLVAKGHSFTITIDGKPVAQIRPSADTTPEDASEPTDPSSDDDSNVKVDR
jgi:antitoxin (DNA-binding transcriptional repressor) of toxin-antitoxin stability system